MMFLGFSAGLPFLLVFTTLSAWLTQAEVSRSTIGFFSWVGITYSIKVFWAPVVDHLPLPVLTSWLGKRRSWMLIAQLGIAAALMAMAFTNPQTDLKLMAIFALLVAFGSATQDIAIDAYRIEAVDENYQGGMAAMYVLGYRIALLVAGAGALLLADTYSWTVSYSLMAMSMLIGVITTLVIREPDRAEQTETKKDYDSNRSSVSRISAWIMEAIIKPFIDFFQRNGWLAIMILLLIGSYRISDISMGVMANPFYLDKGFSLSEIAYVIKVYGFTMTIAGVFLGGALVARYGLLKPLLYGAILVVVTNLLFVYLALNDPDLVSLALVISADNLSAGIATSTFIAYLSSLTNTAYTATQYALFSSFMTLPGKTIGGFAGVVVDSAGYPSFFLYTGLLGVPAILLICFLMQREKNTAVGKVPPQ
ncbi:MAG: MFS transporter [Gammaproteobacteria bacterium]|nr:MFS transporter [Gammaproteobacteria bacterium]